MTKNIAVFALVMLTLGTVAATSPSTVLADWLLDRSGALVQVDGSILGDDDSSDHVEEVETETETESETERTPRDYRAREAKKGELEQKREVEQKRQENAREALKKQTEARLKTQERTKEKSRLEINEVDGETLLKHEVRDSNDRLVTRKELKMKAGESLHVEQADGSTVKFDRRENGNLEMFKNNIRTRSEFEMKLDEKNDISVTLPNGNTRTVKLPDQALANLLEKGIITQTEDGESSYELTAGKNGEPVYSGVEGEVEKSFLGFKLKFKHKLEVAAADSEDGTVTAGDVVDSQSQETTPWRRFLERFAR